MVRAYVTVRRAAFVLIFAAALIAGIAATLSSGRDLAADGAALVASLKSFSDTLSERLLAAGWWGPVMLFALYLVTTVLMLPMWGFHVATGYAYGTLRSALFIASTQAICAGAAFLCARHVAKPYITGLLDSYYGEKYRAIDAAVARRGLYITVLLRLSPLIPFGINNYLCGCTEIKVWQWVLGTFLGVLPGTTTYCYLGSISKELMEEGDADPTGLMLKKVMMAVQFSAGVAVCWYLNRLSVAALREAGISDAERESSSLSRSGASSSSAASSASSSPGSEDDASSSASATRPRRKSPRIAQRRSARLARSSG